MKNFISVAHRGGHGPYQENTVEAFQHAIANGAESVEMDVRFDHFRQRFYLEHDLLHSPKNRKNVMDKVIPALPKNIVFFVELKTVAWLTKNFARAFVSSFKKYFSEEKTIVMSFNPFILMHLKKLAPQIRRGYLLGNPFWSFFFRRGMSRLIDPEILLLHKRLFNSKRVSFGRAQGMKIMAFVLNNEKEWQRALDLGVDGIVTDMPVELKKFLEKR